MPKSFVFGLTCYGSAVPDINQWHNSSLTAFTKGALSPIFLKDICGFRRQDNSRLTIKEEY